MVDDRTGPAFAASAAEEYTFCTTAPAAGLRDQSYGSKLARLFQDNGLRTKSLKIGWYASTINQDRNSAQVDMDNTFDFVTAKAAYLKANGLRTNTPYTQRRSIGLKKVDGSWLIDSLRKYPLAASPAGPGTNPGSWEQVEYR